MNPTYINRKELIKKFNLNVKPKPENVEVDDASIESVIKQDKNYEDKNYDIALSTNIIALLPAIDKNDDHLITPSKSANYVYKLGQVLNSDLVNTKSKKLIHLCIFNIIENPRVFPILLYLLNKDQTTNIIYFPHFYTTENIFDKASENLNKIFEDWSSKPKFKGYLETGHNIYIFYEQKYPHVLEKIHYKDLWWWASLFEIVNTRTILNFAIDRTVYSIFYKKPTLISLFDSNNNKLVTPYIGYYGAYYTYIAFIAAFGLPKQTPTQILGPYYYFYTYYGAGRWAMWSGNRKSEIINDESITIDEYGLYKQGGIARFAIFGDKMKYFLNRETDPDDDSKISQEAAKEIPFYKNTLKIRDVDGKWADNHNIAYIGSVLVKNEKYKDRLLSIQFAVRDFYQQIPLSYHYVDTSEFSKIKGTIKQRDLPYDYEDYNIT